MAVDVGEHRCCSNHHLFYDLLRPRVPSLGKSVRKFLLSLSPFALQYISKGRYLEAHTAMLCLRPTPLQAARDMFYTNALLEVEADIRRGRNLLLELFRVPRNRRAAQVSCLVTFMQQFCGVNVIAYYSTTIFLQAGFSRTSALLVTTGTGLVNWIFAAPTLYTSMSGKLGHLCCFPAEQISQLTHSEGVISC